MNKKGFTLVEVMVSFTLISVISIFLFQIISVVRDVYINQGQKTELYLDQANVSNYINKDLYSLMNDNNLKKIEKQNDTTVVVTPKTGMPRTLIVDNDNRTINYNEYEIKFLEGTKFGSIEVNDTYESVSSNVTKPGVFNIVIPVTYKEETNNYNINVVMRYNSNTSVVK